MRSVYIHIPFCNNICTYCDFCKMYYKEEWVNKYLDVLQKEIETYYQNDKIKTIYIGGGTPSSLNMTQLEKLFSILKILKLNKNIEFTFECNIEDINEKLMQKLKHNKVNRLSIGVQSFNKDYLKLMGRNITCNIEEKIKLAKKYFYNINIDLIYGIKNQTLYELKQDLDKIISLNPTHISLYSLILEENTILKANKYQELDDDTQRDMYDYIRKTLNKNNYIHYEISNFSKKGYSSKHNLTYWNNEEYYGFGLGASGFINNIRYTNTRSFNEYLKKKYHLEENNLSIKENMENEMILGLRKINGVSKIKFKNKYNKEIENIFSIKKLNENKNYLYISKKNLYISNSILIDFIE